ncbi:speckle-type POZ [Fusarium sp. NRRL 52700]|nr:speckle-type POZ [Fusarium sp. NRRL 52700]
MTATKPSHLRIITSSHQTIEPQPSYRRLSTMSPQPHPFLMDLVESGEFSDFTLRCQESKFTLHEMIVCPQSRVISTALRNGYKETTTKVINVNEFDVGTVQCMIDFLYTGDYRIAPEPEKPVVAQEGEDRGARSDEDKMTDDSTESEDSSEKTTGKILSHLRVNAIADYYNIQRLITLSTLKIHKILKGHFDVKILPTVFKEMATTNRNPELRAVMVDTTAKYIGELTSSRVLRKLDLEHDLTLEILEACESRDDEKRRKDLIVAKAKSIIKRLGGTAQCCSFYANFACYV